MMSVACPAADANENPSPPGSCTKSAPMQLSGSHAAVPDGRIATMSEKVGLLRRKWTSTDDAACVTSRYTFSGPGSVPGTHEYKLKAAGEPVVELSTTSP